MEHDLWSNRVVTTAVVAVVFLRDGGDRLNTTHLFNSGRRSETRTVKVHPCPS